jgi:cysteine synthase
MKIYNDITEMIGNTPLVRINKLTANMHGNVYVKIETQNPGYSVKDRVGLALINDAEKKGLINYQSTIIEPTSGNTGIALAMICVIKNLKLIVVMPENMSIERRKIISSFGAEIILTPASDGMKGAVEKAESLAENIPNSYIPFQFKNPANAEIHKRTTAIEIWNDTDGKVDIIIAGVGTGGTITGIAEELKERNTYIKAIAVEPKESPVLSGGEPSTHLIQGIGAGFIPEILNLKILDEIFQVSAVDAITTTKKLIREEGILCGISSGANVYAALQIAERIENRNKNIVTFICDTAERYLTTSLFN